MFWLAAFGMVYLVVLAAIVIGVSERKNKLRMAPAPRVREHERE